MSDRKTPQERRQYQFEQCYMKLAVKHGRAPTSYELAEAGFPPTTVRQNYGGREEIYATIKKKHPARMMEIPLDKAHDTTPKRTELAKAYAKKYKELRRVPTFAEVGISDKTAARLFGNQEGLHNYSREHFPSYFFDVSVETLNTRTHLEQLEETISTKRRFIVTTAVEGCPADTNFLKSIKTYCEERDAALLVLLCADPAARSFGTQIDAKISEFGHVILKDTALNENLFLSTIKVSAKQIEPLTGLLRIGQRNGSMILASPKQHLKLVATSNENLPHALMTTGCVTQGNYDTDKYMSERTAYIAMHDHVIGGIVVEIEDDKIFHYRQIQADAKGRFVDLGVMYSAQGTTEFFPEAIIPGDWHTQSTDPVARKLFLDEIVPALQPAQLFLHDFFDGLSVNHHERKSLIKRAQRAHDYKLGLQEEVTALRDELMTLRDKTNTNIFIVKSNHDLFLERYLANGYHVQDPQNLVFGGLLLNVAVTGRDPLQHGVEMVTPKDPGPIDNVTWLGLNDDVRVGGVQLAAHGHLGPNGGRDPSLKGMEQAYGQCMVGHLHTPEILRGAWRVGTMSKLRLGYNEGPSSWLHSIGLVYSNGARQLINVIGGKWRLNDAGE